MPSDRLKRERAIRTVYTGYSTYHGVKHNLTSIGSDQEQARGSQSSVPSIIEEDFSLSIGAL